MRLFLALATGVMIAASGSVAVGAEVLTIAHEGLSRQARLVNADTTPKPLVVLLHGYQDAEDAAESRAQDLAPLEWPALSALAEDEGFAVVYPAARGGAWAITEFYERALHPETGTLVDDTGFVFALVGRLIAEGRADPARVYLAGISDGAIMSFYLICRSDHPFAAAVALIGMMQESVARGCRPRAIPFLTIAGTNDRILPYDGWMFGSGRELSVAETLHVFATAHGCTRQRARMLEDKIVEDMSRLRLVWWRECDGPEGSVRLLRAEGAGHTLPHPDPIDADWARRAGGHNRDTDAAVEVWNFLSGPPPLPR